MSEGSATANLRIKTKPEEVEALALAFDKLLVAVRGTLTSSKAFLKTKQQLASAGREVATETAKATGAIRAEGAAANTTATSVQKLATSSDNLSKKVGVAVGALLTMELAKKAVATASRILTTSITAFASTNETAAAQVAGLAQASDALAVSFGRALVGGEAGAQTFGALTGIVSSLTAMVDQNAAAINSLAQRAIGGLLSVLPAAVSAFATLINTINIGRLAYLGVEVAVNAVLEALVQWNAFLAQSLLGTISTITEGIASMTGGLAALASAAGLDGMSESLASAAESAGVFADRVSTLDASVGEFAANSRTAYAASLDRYAEAARGIGNDMVAVQLGADSLNASLASLSDQYAAGTLTASEYRAESERVTASAVAQAEALKRIGESLNAEDAKRAVITKTLIDLQAERLGIESAMTLQQQKAAELSAAELERFKALEEMTRMKSESDARALATMEKRVGLMDKIGSSLASTIGGIAGALAEGGQNIGRLLGKMMGEILVSTGSTQVALGLMNLIPPPFNPLGNPAIAAPQIAYGSAAVVAGVALGAASRGGGGRGAGGGSSPAATGTVGTLPAPSQSSETYINNITGNFGFVTDPEASMAEFARVGGRMGRLGYT